MIRETAAERVVFTKTTKKVKGCRGCYGERGIATATTLKFLQNASTPVAEGVTVNVVLQQKYNMGGKGCRGCYSG